MFQAKLKDLKTKKDELDAKKKTLEGWAWTFKIFKINFHKL